jgi:hypothetical protein
VNPAEAVPAPVRAPDVFDRWGEALADRVNPIIVKEVRQGLRTRVFWVFFTLMLTACLFISLGFFGAADVGATSGQAAFVAFFVCLGGVQFFVIPYSAYRSMARETEEETWVLLTLTGIGPRRILSGKLGSSVLQGSLYASAAAPFLLFSYYLNGIDLPTIVVGVVASVAYQLFLVSVSVSVATMAESRIVRAMLHFGVLGMLLFGVSTGIGLSSGLAEMARRLLAGGTFWLVSSAVVLGLVSTAVLLFETAAARLSLATEDYARGPRLAFMTQFTGLFGYFLWGWTMGTDPDVLVIGAVVCAAYLLFVGVMVMTDRDGMSRSHWASGGRWSLLKPGALRGYTCVVLAVVLSGGLFVGLSQQTTLGSQERLVVLAAPAFVLVYLGGSNVIARWLPHRAAQTPALVRLTFLALMVLGCGLPPLIGQIVSEPDDLVLNALNPIMGLVNIGKNGLEGTPFVAFVYAAALVTTTWAFVSLRSRDVEPRA